MKIFVFILSFLLSAPAIAAESFKHIDRSKCVPKKPIAASAEPSCGMTTWAQDFSSIQKIKDYLQKSKTDEKDLEEIFVGTAALSKSDLQLWWNLSINLLNSQLAKLSPEQWCDISDLELMALRYYTVSGYAGINQFLRGQRSDKSAPSLQKLIELVNRALDKMPPFKKEVFRGDSLPDAVLVQHKVGEILTYKAFTSTSKSRLFQYPHCLRISGKSGRDISQLSHSPGEEEVLFKSGTKFKVLKRTEDPKIPDAPWCKVEIEMEEVE